MIYKEDFGYEANMRIDRLEDELKQLQEEVEAWRETARYDVKMSGKVFSGLDRSKWDRCRKKYIEGVK